MDSCVLVPVQAKLMERAVCLPTSLPPVLEREFIIAGGSSPEGRFSLGDKAAWRASWSSLQKQQQQQQQPIKTEGNRLDCMSLCISFLLFKHGCPKFLYVKLSA